jgi:very-short-patch-repair endonuclease
VRLYEHQPVGTVPRARQLRRDASDPERRLLRAIREAFPGRKWRHQSPVGPFYVDILCLSERLAIEVDGDTHTDSERYDATRTKFIKGEGLSVLRFANGDVMENIEGVLTQISLSFQERERDPKGRKGEDSSSPLPSPRAAAWLAPLPQGEGK